jgi:hypothetical protein
VLAVAVGAAVEKLGNVDHVDIVDSLWIHSWIECRQHGGDRLYILNAGEAVGLHERFVFGETVKRQLPSKNPVAPRRPPRRSNFACNLE